MESLKHLFHQQVFTGKREEHYQSTKYPELTSTTFELARSHHCIHCGSKALPVQKTIEDRFNDFVTDYIDAGYRCTCTDAIREMASNLAFTMFDFPRSFKCNFNRIPDKIVTKIMEKKKTFSIDLFSAKGNGEIIAGSSNESFLSKNKDKIKLYVEDSYFHERPLAIFMDIVQSEFDGFMEKEEARREQSLQNLSEKQKLYFKAVKNNE